MLYFTCYEKYATLNMPLKQVCMYYHATLDKVHIRTTSNIISFILLRRGMSGITSLAGFLQTGVMQNHSKRAVKIVYTNWKNKTSERVIIPRKLVFTTSRYKNSMCPDWYIKARCLTKHEDRLFSLQNIHRWERVEDL